MNEIRNRWESLLHSRPGLIGNARLIGGHISYNGDRDKTFNFITSKGFFTYNPRTDEFKRTFQVC